MKVVVLGAGVVGTTSAWYLARAGHEVTVIERQPGPALETSYANGGQIAVAHAEPWANPRTPLKALKWLGRRDAPLLLRLRADPALAAWLVRFLVNCTPARSRRNIERTVRIALYSRACLRELRAETGLEYEQKTRGILHFYRDRGEFDHALKANAVMREHGLERRGLDAAGCVAVEPALAHVRPHLVGGLYSPDDENGNARLFTERLAAMAQGAGVVFAFGESVRHLEAEGGRIAAVHTATGRTRADAVLVAMGSYTPLLLRPLGIRLPVYPAKGYSVSIPVAGHAGAPEVSLTDDERKIVYSRLGDTLRVAGTAEFAGYDTALDRVRIDAVLRAAMDTFPDCGEAARAEPWTGLRPKTPDSLPVLGPTRYENLFLNTGHGTLGWTMACGSARAVADMMSGRRPEIEVSDYRIDRF